MAQPFPNAQQCSWPSRQGEGGGTLLTMPSSLQGPLEGEREGQGCIRMEGASEVAGAVK